MTNPGLQRLHALRRVVSPAGETDRTDIPATSGYLVRVTFWILLFLAVNYAYLRLIYGEISQIYVCCDAYMYLEGGRRFLEEGILAETHLEGYRSIHNYAVVGVILSLGSVLFHPLGELPPPGVVIDLHYTVGAYFLYAAIATVFTLFLSGSKGFPTIFSAIFLNPISNSYVPLPLQESQMALLALPLAGAAFVLLRNAQYRCAVFIISAFAAIAWMSKASLLPLAILSLAFLFLAARSSESPRSRITDIILSAVLFATIVAPQSYVALHKFGTIFPYPERDVLSFQLDYGYQVWKWETVIIDAGTEAQRPAGRGLFTSFSPPGTGSYVEGLIQQPMKAISLFAGHLVASFDYSDLRVYIISIEPKLISLANILFGSLLLMGIIEFFRRTNAGKTDLADWFLIAVAAGSAAALPFVAVETRFSYIPSVIVLTYSVSYLLSIRRPAAEVGTITASILFGYVFALAAFLLHQSARLV